MKVCKSDPGRGGTVTRSVGGDLLLFIEFLNEINMDSHCGVETVAT